METYSGCYLKTKQVHLDRLPTMYDSAMYYGILLTHYQLKRKNNKWQPIMTTELFAPKVQGSRLVSHDLTNIQPGLGGAK